MKIEKLELKHLAPYLPYGLKVETNGKIGKVDGINIGFFNESDTKIYTETDYDGSHIWMVKPILRPLSDLTKEIIHEWVKFVPTVELAKICGVSLDSYRIDSQETHQGIYLDGKGFGYDTENSYFYAFNQHNEIDYVKNQDKLFQKMYELKFDIYNLIKSGLAIDINTVKV